MDLFVCLSYSRDSSVPWKLTQNTSTVPFLFGSTACPMTELRITVP